MKILSTKEAAEKLKISPVRVRQLIQSGRLCAKKLGHHYAIKEQDLAALEVRLTGRPRKKSAKSNLKP